MDFSETFFFKVVVVLPCQCGWVRVSMRAKCVGGAEGEGEGVGNK